MDMRKYINLFIEEADKYIKAFFTLFDQLKDASAYDQGLINEIFRNAHSIKGMAASVGFGNMADLAHKLEELFHYYRDAKVLPDKKAIEAISAGIDVLYQKLMVIKDKQQDDIDAAAVIARLEGFYSPMAQQHKPMALTGQLISKKAPLLVIYFKRSPLAIAKAFVVIKRLKTMSDAISFYPSANELKVGKFEGYIKVFGENNKLVGIIESALAKESAVSRVERLQERPASRSKTKEKAPKATPGQDAVAEVKLADKGKRAKRSAVAGKLIGITPAELDFIINGMGEIYLHKTILAKRLKPGLEPDAKEVFSRMSTLIKRTYGKLISLRMVPFQHISQEFPYIIKMVSERQKKRVRLAVSGEGIEIDRMILEELKNPLIHILRNAVDHGIEGNAVRKERGKPEFGSIHIKVERKAENIQISVHDDGRGIALQDLKAKAKQLGVLSEGTLEKMPDEDVIRLITRPGFSLAGKVSEISGRGVGMDIVKNVVEKLGGRLVITTEEGIGTVFKLIVPLTMAIQEIIIVQNQGEEIAFPTRVIETTMVLDDAVSLVHEKDHAFIRLKEDLLPAYRLNRHMNIEPYTKDKHNGCRQAVLIGGRHPSLLFVDKLKETRQTVIKRLPYPFNRFRFLSAVTIGDRGVPMMIIDPMRLIDFNFEQQRSRQDG